MVNVKKHNMKDENGRISMRILAVKMEDELFDEVKAHVKEQGITTQQYVNDVIAQDVHKQKQSQEVQQSKTWEKEEVEQAIGRFIKEYGRVPTQKEFRNENSLPSYKAATRSLEESPAQYAQRQFEEFESVQNEEPEETFSMSM